MKLRDYTNAKKPSLEEEGLLPKLNYSYYYYLQKKLIVERVKNRVPDTLTGTLKSHKFIPT